MTCRIGKDNIILVTGILTICLGCLMNLYWEDGFKSVVYQRLVLTNKSKTYEPWQKSKHPFIISFYFFNWTNPGDLKDPDYKPEFKEIGPYNFWEKAEKVNLTWNNNGTVSYKRLRSWHFDANSSVGTLNDSITSINVVAVSAAHMMRNWGYFVKASLATPFSSSVTLAVTKQIGEYLFDGYHDPLLSFASKLPGLSAKIPFDRFGWFYPKNGSYEKDGLFNIETGANGIDVFGSVRNWNAKNHTGFYPDHCGNVVGSGGDFWPPRTTKDPVTIFTPDLCRYLPFQYTDEVLINDVRGFHYEVGKQLIDNGEEYPENKCFCNGECVPVGALNVSSCRSDAPVFVSYPHFYLADQSYLDGVVGMQPDAEKHKIYMVLEPTFGFPLEVAARLQINVLIQPDPVITLLRGVKKVFFPVFWFEQKVTIGVPKETSTFITIVNILPTAGFITSLILIIGGILCIVFVSYYKLCMRNRKKLTINIARNSHETKEDAANYGLIRSEYKSDPKLEINANGDKTITNATLL